MLLPIVSGLAAMVAGALLFVPVWAVGLAVSSSERPSAIAGGVAAIFAMSAVSIYFQAALTIAANERADGRAPTLGSALSQAARLWRQILGWSALTTTVGTVVRAVEQRLGIFGRLLGLLGGLVWAIASFLVVPVLVVEGLGPIAAVKRSAELIRATWGTGLRTTLRLGWLVAVAFVLGLLMGIPGAVLLFTSTTTTGVALGAALLGLDLLALFVLGAFASAVYSYARTMIYRYATGRPVPGIPPAAFAGVFLTKRKRRRWA